MSRVWQGLGFTSIEEEWRLLLITLICCQPTQTVIIWITVYRGIIQIKYFTPHNLLLVIKYCFVTLLHPPSYCWTFSVTPFTQNIEIEWWGWCCCLIFVSPKLGTRQKPLKVFYSGNSKGLLNCKDFYYKSLDLSPSLPPSLCVI